MARRRSACHLLWQGTQQDIRGGLLVFHSGRRLFHRDQSVCIRLHDTQQEWRGVHVANLAKGNVVSSLGLLGQMADCRRAWGEIQSDKRGGQTSKFTIGRGYFLSLYTLKQDLEHLAGEYHLADYRTNSPCELCPCTRAKNDWENNFHNFNDDALWMTKVFTAAEWNASHDSPHYLLQEAHMTCLNVEPDEAHILHLGVSQYCLGSVLWQLCYSCESLDGEADANCEVVWQGVREVYREQRTSTQMGNLLIKSFVSPQKWSDEYPRLRAKAAETKDIVYPIFRVWERFRSLRDPDHDRVSLMLRALVDLQAILHDSRHLPILPIAHALKFRDLVRGFLKDYALLANSADREKASLYSLVPKHHWLWHLADRALFINPRRSCCLLDEDYVGKIKLVVASCAFGTPLHNVQS